MKAAKISWTKSLICLFLGLLNLNLALAQEEIPTLLTISVNGSNLEFKNDQFELFAFEPLSATRSLILAKEYKTNKSKAYLLDGFYTVLDEIDLPRVVVFLETLNRNKAGEFPLYSRTGDMLFLKVQNDKLQIRKEEFAPMFMNFMRLQSFQEDYIYTQLRLDQRVVQVISSNESQLWTMDIPKKYKADYVWNACQIEKDKLLLFDAYSGQGKILDKHYQELSSIQLDLDKIHKEKYGYVRLVPVDDKMEDFLLVFSKTLKYHTLYHFKLSTQKIRPMGKLLFPVVGNFMLRNNKLFFIAFANKKSKNQEENMLLFVPWKRVN